jgi:hypothetical protein
MHPDQAVNAGGISSIICVGSTENNDHISNFSSPGPGTWADIPEYADYPYAPGDTTQIGIIKPDICAPGGNVVSLGFPGNDTYKADLGTSFAAPCVTGTIALMLSKNPNLTPAQIDEIIETTAVKLSEHKSNDYGSGRIDALAAVAVALKLAVPSERIGESLASFRNLSGRQEIIKTKDYTIIKDCYNAGPESMTAALKVLGNRPGRHIAVLGDMLELGDCAQAEHYKVGRIAAEKADLVFAYGPFSSRVIDGTLTGGMPETMGRAFEDREELVKALKRTAKPGDIILFKASHGMHLELVLEAFLKNEK